jgi:hypothetical protein
MRSRSPLPRSRRRALGRVLRERRQSRGLSLMACAGEISDRLGGIEGPSWQWVQHREGGPPDPLANALWVDAHLSAVGVTWVEALRTLGLDAEARGAERVIR